MNFDSIKKIVNCRTKNKKVIFSVTLLFLLVEIWSRIEFNYNFSIWKINIDIIIKIILSLIFVIGLVLLFFPPLKKNKSKKQGIGFYIDSSSIKKKDFRKKNFFTELNNRLKNDYEIIVYEKEELENKLKKKNINDLIDELNLNFMFVVRERTGYNNNKDVYELKIVGAYGNFPCYVNQSFKDKFLNDLVFSINHCLSISKFNELKDVDEEVEAFKLGMDYLCSIIFCVSGAPEESLKNLDRISMALDNKKTKKKNLLYIKNNLVYRYIDSYYAAILSIFYNEPYYTDKQILIKLKNYYKKYKEILFENKKNIERNYFRVLNNDAHYFGAIILYEEGKKQNALDLVNKCDLTVNPNTSYLFDKAFLLASLGKYKMSYDVYCRISRKRHIEDWLLNEVIRFIEKRNELDESDINIKFCLAIVNYFFKDRTLAWKYIEELSIVNDAMKQIFDNLH